MAADQKVDDLPVLDPVRDAPFIEGMKPRDVVGILRVRWPFHSEKEILQDLLQVIQAVYPGQIVLPLEQLPFHQTGKGRRLQISLDFVTIPFFARQHIDVLDPVGPDSVKKLLIKSPHVLDEAFRREILILLAIQDSLGTEAAVGDVDRQVRTVDEENVFLLRCFGRLLHQPFKESDVHSVFSFLRGLVPGFFSVSIP